MRGYCVDELKNLIVMDILQNLLNILNTVSIAKSKYYPCCVCYFNVYIQRYEYNFKSVYRRYFGWTKFVNYLCANTASIYVFPEIFSYYLAKEVSAV
jgi:hypothetical protein